MKTIYYYILLLLFVSKGLEAQDILPLLDNYLKEQKIEGLLPNDYATLQITNQSESKGLIHVYVRQTINDIPVVNGLANFVIQNGNVVFFQHQFVALANLNPPHKSLAIDPILALQLAAEHLTIPFPKESIIPTEKTANGFLYQLESVSKHPIPVELVYYCTETKSIQLAWELNIDMLSEPHWYNFYLDAQTGVVFNKQDWTVSCNFEQCSHTTHTNKHSCKNTESPSKEPIGSNDYFVYALPIESPLYGERSFVSNPSDAVASPFGWHDVDGIEGADFNYTRGNNVYASEDKNGDDVPGNSADGGFNLQFNYALSQDLASDDYLGASITNLFYMNNMMHDVWMRYGFDEQSGNFQENNYSGNGEAHDFVYADAQDGSGMNNANFSTPPDGSNPRMQMYLWTPSANNFLLEIESPSSIAGFYNASTASFGPSVDVNPVSGIFVLVNDGIGDVNDGCESIMNASSLAGNIVVINRGTCTFVEKVEQAEQAGAIGVVIINNVSGNPISMGGSSFNISIPSIMISQEDGLLLIEAINANQMVHGSIENAQLNHYLDSDFDNGIIAHEYGHGISTRLVGGASNVSCLYNAEQMGEGWSDWFGLMMTIQETDSETTPRGIAGYVMSQEPNQNGIRVAPYSTDFAVNNYTYASTNESALSAPHGIGFVWCTMLWDLSWAFINEYGFDSDLHTGTKGNNKVMELVIEGMKLTPCSPGFIDARDALLQADLLLNNGENQCLIWSVFANRGLGFSAQQGSSSSRYDQVEAFDLPLNCSAGITQLSSELQFQLFPNPNQGEFTLVIPNYSDPLGVSILDAQGKQHYSFEIVNGTEFHLNLRGLMVGFYFVQLQNSEGIVETIKFIKQGE
jgi:extracellular elastinolytic metalloproteinase